jgi:hypothetical protein
MKHEESKENNMAVIDYVAKLCAKKKIVWLNDLNRVDKDKTPDFVRFKYLGGQLKNVLNSEYAMGRDLRCVTVDLGELKKQNIIVFNTKNEDYVRKCLREFKKLKDELIALEKDYNNRADVLKRKMIKIGGRYN